MTSAPDREFNRPGCFPHRDRARPLEGGTKKTHSSRLGFLQAHRPLTLSTAPEPYLSNPQQSLQNRVQRPDRRLRLPLRCPLPSRKVASFRRPTPTSSGHSSRPTPSSSPSRRFHEPRESQNSRPQLNDDKDRKVFDPHPRTSIHKRPTQCPWRFVRSLLETSRN